MGKARLLKNQGLKRKHRIFISVILSIVLVFGNFVSFKRAVAMEGTETAEDGQCDRKELVALRQTDSETYLLADGSYESVVYTEDKYYRDAKGDLLPIDNSIVGCNITINERQYKYTNAANSTKCYFESDTVGALLQKDSNSLSFRLLSQGIPVPRLGGIEGSKEIAEYFLQGENCIAFQNIAEDTDAAYFFENAGLKEYLVLNSSHSPHSFCFEVSGEGLSFSNNQNGTIDVIGPDNEIAFQFSKLFAVDSAGVYTEDVHYEISENGNTTVITIVVSDSYLNNPDRAFPVLVDPTVMITGEYSTQDTYVSSRYPTTNYYLNTYLRTGRDDDFYIRRSFLRFNLPSALSGSTVAEAYIMIHKSSGATPDVKAYHVTGSWSSSTLTWNNMPGYTTSNASGTATLTSNDWYKITILPIAARWASGEYTNYGVVLKDATESGTSQWTTFHSSDAASPNKPELHLKYYLPLSYWYSDASSICKWTSSPTISYFIIDFDSSFAFYPGLVNGVSQWNSALGISADLSYMDFTAPIRYYGGKKQDLEDLGYFGSISSSTLGATQYVSKTQQDKYSYNGSIKTFYTLSEVKGYVVSRSDMTYYNYIKTCTHEIGHALGWVGHPSSTQPTWVMQQGISTVTTLSTEEANHLAQIY